MGAEKREHEDIESSAAQPEAKQAKGEGEESGTQWVQCERCDKWRRLPPGCAAPGDDEAWWCALNPVPTHNRCEVPEESLDEGEQHVVGEALGLDGDVNEGPAADGAMLAVNCCTVEPDPDTGVTSFKCRFPDCDRRCAAPL